MPLRTFDFCALQFLNQWLEKESGYYDSLASDDPEKQRLALVAAGGHFRVARNLHTKCEKERNLLRCQPVLDILNKTDRVNLSNVIDIVGEVERNISFEYANGERTFLSLTTKFLWLKFRSPVRIYDKQARIALGTTEGDYNGFNNAFSRCYAQHRERIEQATDNLCNAISYSVQPGMPREDLKNLVSTEWFRERVLDIYLWNEGSVKVDGG